MYNQYTAAPVRISKYPLLRSATLLAAASLAHKLLLERKVAVVDDNPNAYGRILLVEGDRMKNQHRR